MLLASIALCFTLVTSNARADLDENEYLALRGVAAEILKRKPPADHVFVGVGRSPSGLLMLLDQFGVDVAQVPFSRAAITAAVLKGAPDRRTELDHHLGLWLDPVLRHLGGRHLILIDFVVNGSFRSAVRLIADFLERKHPGVIVDYIALASRSNVVGKEDWLSGERVIILDDYPGEFERRLVTCFYERVAPVGTWTLTTRWLSAGTPAQPVNGSYKEALVRRVALDRKSGCQIHLEKVR